MKSEITGSVTDFIHASQQQVWNALTDPALIKQYFFGTDAHTSWKVGEPITFTGEWQGKRYEDKGTVLTFEKYNLVRYTYWSSMSGIKDEPGNYVIVSYRLQPKEDGVELTITQENIPDEQTRKHSEENWQRVIDGLKKLVETQTQSSR
ncbi:MAG TPA: SRPBCC family protein, partial [Chitinophagaceae bacterium]